MQTIYYDPTDADLDEGRGWNVIDSSSDTGTAYRFSTHTEAINFCTANNLPYRLLVEECYENDDE